MGGMLGEERETNLLPVPGAGREHQNVTLAKRRGQYIHDHVGEPRACKAIRHGLKLQVRGLDDALVDTKGRSRWADEEASLEALTVKGNVLQLQGGLGEVSASRSDWLGVRTRSRRSIAGEQRDAGAACQRQEQREARRDHLRVVGPVSFGEGNLMSLFKRWRPYWLISCGVLGCASWGPADADVVRPSSGEPFLPRLPGPMAGGSYDSFSQALIAACQRILAKPGASASSLRNQDFITRWRFSTEYCAWIYYTPAQKYEISRLTDQSQLDPAYRLKTCALPAFVDDPRYPSHAIKYICAIHNHPYGNRLSDFDIRSIVAQGLVHGFDVETKDGNVLLSVVAFISNNTESPSCDGFYQYVPAASSLYRWTRQGGNWSCRKTSVIQWQDAEHYELQEVDAACPDFTDMGAL